MRRFSWRGPIAALPFLLFPLLVGKLWLNGSVGYFINGRTTWIVVVGAALFLAVGVVTIFSRPHGFSPAHNVVFALPLVVGLLAPPHVLSATTGQASTLGTLQLASHVSSSQPGDRFGYWVSSVAAHPQRLWWAGQPATLVGFVSREPDLPSGTFLVSRFLVTCCVVDASLMGFPVRLAKGPLPPNGSWVQVRGRFGEQSWADAQGAQWPILQQASLSRATIPSSPYLSP